MYSEIIKWWFSICHLPPNTLYFNKTIWFCPLNIFQKQLLFFGHLPSDNRLIVLMKINFPIDYINQLLIFNYLAIARQPDTVDKWHSRRGWWWWRRRRWSQLGSPGPRAPWPLLTSSDNLLLTQSVTCSVSPVLHVSQTHVSRARSNCAVSVCNVNFNAYYIGIINV